MTPIENKRLSIPGVNGGQPFQLEERPDLWRKVYNVRPDLFDEFEDEEEEDFSEVLEEVETEEEEPKDWSAEEYNIIYKYFEEGDTMRNIADSNDDYTYNYVRGVINKEKEHREDG